MLIIMVSGVKKTVIEIDSVIDHNTNHDHDDAFGYFEDAQDMNEVNELRAVQVHIDLIDTATMIVQCIPLYKNEMMTVTMI